MIPCINMKILGGEEIETVICDFEFSRLKIWGKLHEGVFSLHMGSESYCQKSKVETTDYDL